MDLNHLLIWTVGAGCGITLLQLIGQKNVLQQMAIPLGILAVLAISLLMNPETAGHISGVLFVLLLLAPA